MNERAKRDGEAKDSGKLHLESGNHLEADLVIWTVGGKPNTDWLRSTEFGAVLDEQGRVKVGRR